MAAENTEIDIPDSVVVILQLKVDGYDVENEVYVVYEVQVVENVLGRLYEENELLVYVV